MYLTPQSLFISHLSLCLSHISVSVYLTSQSLCISHLSLCVSHTSVSASLVLSLSVPPNSPVRAEGPHEPVHPEHGAVVAVELLVVGVVKVGLGLGRHVGGREPAHWGEGDEHFRHLCHFAWISHTCFQ